ncbi:restriction endonuclease subunit S [Serratia fonticola]|uniref:restriction endonuclease subunit S n=1 Tax=Serratia fonticola TaxID=47917 RepID=UPI003AB00336
MLNGVEWGDFRIGDLFEKVKANKLPFKADELPKEKTGEYTLPCLTSSFNNQGLNYFVPRDGATILKDVISIPSNSDVYRAYFQSNEFTVLSDSYAIKWIFSDIDLLPEQYLFLVQCINKVTDLDIYSYKNKLGGWNIVKDKKIQLPIKNGNIDFNFMSAFVSLINDNRMKALDEYLKRCGLNDYNLTQDECEALNKFNNDDISWGEFKLSELFNKIEQGRRLKKDDQVKGEIPFVMSGVTNSGVVNFISNPVSLFPENSITVDIFGNVFYREYEFGAGDDTGVYWNDENEFSKENMLFLAASMGCALKDKYDFGNKLRSSQSKGIKVNVVVKNNDLDSSYINNLISALQKQVIKDVVQYSERNYRA